MIVRLVDVARGAGIPIDLKLPPKYFMIENNSVELATKYSAVHTGKDNPELVARMTQFAGQHGSVSVWHGCGDRENRFVSCECFL